MPSCWILHPQVCTLGLCSVTGIDPLRIVIIQLRNIHKCKQKAFKPENRLDVNFSLKQRFWVGDLRIWGVRDFQIKGLQLSSWTDQRQDKHLLPINVAVHQYADNLQTFVNGPVDAALSLVERILDATSALNLRMSSNRLRSNWNKT